MSEKLTVTAEISTKDRYFTTLPSAILSIAMQTLTPDKLLIFDDGEHKDLRAEPVYQNLFSLLAAKNIDWSIIYGQRIGQVANHQKANEICTTDLIWRNDDDDAPEPNVLEKLIKHFDDPMVGATSGLVWIPGAAYLSAKVCSGKIEDVWSKPNIQWSDQKEIIDVEHLNNTFLYRRDIAPSYCMELSPVGFGEESLFSYSIKKKGYKLILDPSAKIWHLRSPVGGIRSYRDQQMWEHDSKIAKQKLSEMGVILSNYKLICLDSGLGDHFMFKSILPEIKVRYKDCKLQLAVCYPEVFEDDNVELISIADAMTIESNMDKHNIYRWCIDHNHQGHLIDAMKGCYL